MACETTTYTNILNLPQVTNVDIGDFFILEQPEGTVIIDYKDVLWSLDNMTFSLTISGHETRIIRLESQVQSLCAAISGMNAETIGVPSVMNIRISLSPTTPTPTTNLSGAAANTLYIHPYKGNSVTLYNPSLSSWKTYDFNTKIALPLAEICTVPSTNYDIYMSVDNNGSFNITSVTLPSNPGDIDLSTYRRYINGVAVNPVNTSQRLIGCIRSDEVAGRSIQTFGGRLSGGFHCKQYVWNAQNQVPVNCWGFDNSTYYAQAASWTNWRKVNPDMANGPTIPSTHKSRFSFIVGDYTAVNLTAQIYISYYADLNLPVAYTALAIDTENDKPSIDGGLMISELRGSDVTPRAQLLRTFLPGYHFIQQLENIAAQNKVMIMNEGHDNQTGYIVTLHM